jgi:hypothetical protein
MSSLFCSSSRTAPSVWSASQPPQATRVHSQWSSLTWWGSCPDVAMSTTSTAWLPCTTMGIRLVSVYGAAATSYTGLWRIKRMKALFVLPPGGFGSHTGTLGWQDWTSWLLSAGSILPQIARLTKPIFTISWPCYPTPWISFCGSLKGMRSCLWGFWGEWLKVMTHCWMK